jgi:suppressor of G2 allele of SKP1
VVLRQNIISTGPNAKPVTPYTGSTSRKDWTALEQQAEKEEAENPGEGPNALHKLFQQIYQNGSDDVKKAMMKSYQTSAGTVLSTNWGEVQNKDYEKEITPPAGMEVKKWK